MKPETRVLGRVGARDLTQEEVAFVTGAFRNHTLSPCAVDRNGNLIAGDINECGGA